LFVLCIGVPDSDQRACCDDHTNVGGISARGASAKRVLVVPLDADVLPEALTVLSAAEIQVYLAEPDTGHVAALC
jgi:hypothetical protein